MASVEAGKFNTVGADRVLEQALACDFSIRSAPRFRLVKAIIRAQQVIIVDCSQGLNESPTFTPLRSKM
jgi:hypothetical protein